MRKLTVHEKKLIVITCVFFISLAFAVNMASFFMASATADKSGTVTFISPVNDFMNTITFTEMYMMFAQVSVASCLLGVSWAFVVSYGWKVIKSYKEQKP